MYERMKIKNELCRNNRGSTKGEKSSLFYKILVCLQGLIKKIGVMILERLSTYTALFHPNKHAKCTFFFRNIFRTLPEAEFKS